MNSVNIKKSSPEEIKKNFDLQVERFINIETGQSTAIDSPLCMELIGKSALITNPEATSIMDIGCGGGNYAIKVASLLNNPDCTLVDFSENMLYAAEKRLKEITKGEISTLLGDYREIDLGENKFDIIIAGTTLHHLREENEWELVFGKIYKALKFGGSFWINDIIISETDEINQMMINGWINILKERFDDEYITNNMKKYKSEDSPRSLSYQLELLKKTGFSKNIVLHKHFNFAAFGAIK